METLKNILPALCRFSETTSTLAAFIFVYAAISGIAFFSFIEDAIAAMSLLLVNALSLLQRETTPVESRVSCNVYTCPLFQKKSQAYVTLMDIQISRQHESDRSHERRYINVSYYKRLTKFHPGLTSLHTPLEQGSPNPRRSFVGKHEPLLPSPKTCMQQVLQTECSEKYQ